MHPAPQEKAQRIEPQKAANAGKTRMIGKADEALSKTDPAPVRGRQGIYTRDVLLVMAGAFFFMFSTMAINPLINGYAEQLGASDELAGVVAGIMSFAALFLRPMTGHLADRFTKHLLSTIGGILIIIGTLGYPLARDPGWLLLFRVINGMGYVLCTVCVSTWIAFLVPRTHVGEAMGLYGLMNALAMSLAPAVSINLYHSIGYQRTMIVSPISATIMLVLLQFVGNPGRPVKPRQNDDSARAKTPSGAGAATAAATPVSAPARKQEHLRFAIIQKDALPVGILTTLFGLPYFITQADIVRYTEELHAPVAVGASFFIYAALLRAIRMVCKRQFDTVPDGRWFWISMAGTAVYLLADIWMANNAVMALSAAGMAVGYGIIYSINQATVMMLAPISEQGMANATFYLGLDVAMSLGPVLGGIIDAHLPIRAFFAVQLIVLLLAVLVYLPNKKKLDSAIHNR